MCVRARARSSCGIPRGRDSPRAIDDSSGDGSGSVGRHRRAAAVRARDRQAWVRWRAVPATTPAAVKGGGKPWGGGGRGTPGIDAEGHLRGLGGGGGRGGGAGNSDPVVGAEGGHGLRDVVVVLARDGLRQVLRACA